MNTKKDSSIFSRRIFLRGSVLSSATGCVAFNSTYTMAKQGQGPAFAGGVNQPPNGEALYNGIILPKVWPPVDMDPDSHEPMLVPYLQSPPNVIPIDVSRQLFVDDFRILTR